MKKDVNYTPNLNEYLKLGYFKGWVLQNFPYIEEDFDALTNYELISKLCGYTNKIHENQDLEQKNITALADAFNQLQAYVNNELSNLNLQEEVNNKLDEMAENGELENIIANYIDIHVVKTYENVQAMKEANLENGNLVNTLGYFKKGDSGNASYIITDTEPNTYYEQLNNNLYAQLLVTNNEISPQQFGSYADNVHDDSSAIQKCIDFAEAIVISNNSISAGEPEILLFGNYKIENGIIFSPYLTYHLKGDATIISYLTEGIAVSIEYREMITSDLNQNRSNGWSRGDLFYGGNLFIVNSDNTINNNVIGLSINNAENLQQTFQSFSRGRIQNISVTYFNIGLKINVFHFYIQSFYNIILHNNNTNLKIGDEVLTNVDSGENILFQNCLLGTSVNYGTTINIATLNITFQNCSFDYNNEGTIRIFKQTAIRLTNCHIEDCHKGSLNALISSVDDNIFGQVYLNNVYFVNGHETAPLVSGKNLSVVIDDIRESTLANTTNINSPDNFYLVPNCYYCSKQNMFSNIRMTAPLLNKYRYQFLSDEIVGTEIVQGGTTKTVSYNYANQFTNMSIASDNSENVVKIAASDSQLLNGAFNITEYIEVDNLYSRCVFSYLYKFTEGSVEPQISFLYYDENKKSLGNKTWIGRNQNKLNPGGWQKPIVNGFIQGFPEKTKYVRVRLSMIARSYVPEILLKQFHFEFI